MRSYTVGLIFDSALREVVLMEKTHPDWQKGKLNGIGGKIEEGESCLQCIVRETKEETGLLTDEENWQQFATIFDSDSRVDFFGLVHSGPKEEVATVTEEKVAWYPISAIPSNTIPNVLWLVPMALEKLQGNTFEVVEVKYN